MRKFITFFILVVSIAFPYFCNADTDIQASLAKQIRLGTFNIEKLGKANEYQAKNAAEILKNYDIVAIQEVMNFGATKGNPKGDNGIEALKRIVSCLGDDWAYVISPEPNGTGRAEKKNDYKSFEYYAFLYRKSKVDLINGTAGLWDEQSRPMAGMASMERQFDREPFIASFRAKSGRLDFTIITIHTAAPGVGWRRDEINRLAVVYKAVQDSDANQNDVFLMGDFNTNVDKKEWDSLKSLPAMKHILTSGDITTLNKAGGRLSKSQYDTVWYQGSYSDEDIVPETAQVDQAWKENLSFTEDIKIPKKMKNERRQIWLYGKFTSDHLPVTMLLWIDKDTDNFQN